MKVYDKVYNYYIDMMTAGSLRPGDRMPSIREATAMTGASRTSVETAYLNLAADGYIYAIERKGYYVTEMAGRLSGGNSGETAAISSRESCLVRAAESAGRLNRWPDENDAGEATHNKLLTIGQDPSVSCVPLWSRYMKNALRQEERLLTYSDNQGEPELREAIASYIYKTRNIICSPQEIVIGAGFQNLLAVLIPLLNSLSTRTVSFPTREFEDGVRTFADMGYEVSYRDKKAHIIYVAPTYMTKWGDIMSMKRRREIIDHARTDDHILIEDDYRSELVFSQKPTPSLYAMSGGERVVYMGSFSGILMPGVRISFMILPKELREAYADCRHLYNQSAGKTEQIALTQFLRDGQLMRHVRKMRRCYGEKREVLRKALTKACAYEILSGDSGTEMGLKRISDGRILLLSCSSCPVDEIESELSRLLKTF